jgi:hypothetical protein
MFGFNHFRFKPPACLTYEIRSASQAERGQKAAGSVTGTQLCAGSRDCPSLSRA